MNRDGRPRVGWSQEQLEAATERLGTKVDQRNISKMESGLNADPRNRTVDVLERALGIPRGTLIFTRRKLAA